MDFPVTHNVASTNVILTWGLSVVDCYDSHCRLSYDIHSSQRRASPGWRVAPALKQHFGILRIQNIRAHPSRRRLYTLDQIIDQSKGTGSCVWAASGYAWSAILTAYAACQSDRRSTTSISIALSAYHRRKTATAKKSRSQSYASHRGELEATTAVERRIRVTVQ